MAGKIKRQPVIKRGNRGTLGLLGKAHRSKSRTPTKRINPHDRNMDYKKREQLNASIAALEKRRARELDEREDSFGSERKEERAEAITSEDELENEQEELILPAAE
ncbi:unnamed protein product [Bathycoccus prasinos]